MLKFRFKNSEPLKLLRLMETVFLINALIISLFLVILLIISKLYKENLNVFGLYSYFLIVWLSVSSIIIYIYANKKGVSILLKLFLLLLNYLGIGIGGVLFGIVLWIMVPRENLKEVISIVLNFLFLIPYMILLMISDWLGLNL